MGWLGWARDTIAAIKRYCCYLLKRASVHPCFFAIILYHYCCLLQLNTIYLSAHRLTHASLLCLLSSSTIALFSSSSFCDLTFLSLLCACFFGIFCCHIVLEGTACSLGSFVFISMNLRVLFSFHCWCCVPHFLCGGRVFCHSFSIACVRAHLGLWYVWEIFCFFRGTSA